MARREADPEARRLITEVVRLEGEPWPEAIEAYRDTVFALALRCEFNPGKAEFYRWGRRVLHPFLSVNDRRAEHRVDALADIAANAFTWLLRGRAGVDHRRKPNIRSMLRLGMLWRAKDLAVAVERRHHRRRGAARLDLLVAPGSPHTAALAHEVVEQLVAEGSPLSRALLLIGSGEAVAAAARSTGVSRSRIYRARRALASAPSGDPTPRRRLPDE